MNLKLMGGREGERERRERWGREGWKGGGREREREGRNKASVRKGRGDGLL